MISFRPILFTREKLTEEVHPKFLYGHQGWLLALGGFFIIFGVRSIWNLMVELSPIFCTLRLVYDKLGLLLVVATLLKPILLLFTGLALLIKWNYSSLLAQLFVTILPFAVFFSNYTFDMNDQQLLLAASQLFLTNALFVSLPVVLYLHLSKRVHNTFMFYGNKLPKRITCPFCLSNNLPNDDERRNKQLVCSQCGKLISANIVAA